MVYPVLDTDWQPRLVSRWIYNIYNILYVYLQCKKYDSDSATSRLILYITPVLNC